MKLKGYTIVRTAARPGVMGSPFISTTRSPINPLPMERPVTDSPIQ